MTLGLSGIPGLKTVGISQGDLDAETTGTLAAQVAANTDYVGFLQAAAQARIADPFTFTAAIPYNGFRNVGWGYGYAPRVFSNFGTVQSVSGQQLRIANLSGADVWNPPQYLGATVDVFRVTNGVMSRVRVSEVVAADFAVGGRMSWLGLVSGTSFSWRMDTWMRPNVPYWYAVAAVDSSGRVGARSAWVSYTPAAFGTGPATSASDTGFVASPDTGTLDAPTGFAAVDNATGDGTVDMSWDAVEDAVGYVPYIAYTDPATWPANDYLELDSDGGATVLAGDMVIWRKPMMKIPLEDVCSRVYRDSAYLKFRPLTTALGYEDILDWEGNPQRWEIKPWSVEVPKPDPSVGDFYLERTLDEGQQWVEGVYWSGASGQPNYYVKQPGDDFRVDCWVWASAARPATFSSAQPGETAQNWTLPTTWTEKNFSSDYTSAPTGTGLYQWYMSATAGAGGLVVRTAGLKAYNGAEGDFGDMFPELASSTVPGQAFRDHSMIKTRPATYTASQIIGPRGESSIGANLSMLFDACEDNDLTPWIQIEWALSREDFILFAEYLVANASRFDLFKIELGNENWQNGSLPEFWGAFPAMYDSATAEEYISAEVEGMYLTMAKGWMSTVSGWSTVEDKLHFQICGQSVGSYGEDVYREFPEAKAINGAYYGSEGWDTGHVGGSFENGVTFSRMLGFVETATKPWVQARIAGAASVAAEMGTTLGVDVVADWYEGATGYAIPNSITAAEVIVQQAVTKSIGGGAANLDQFLYAQSVGQRPNFFTLSFGDFWTSHREDGVEFLNYTAAKVLVEKLGSYRVYPILAARNDRITVVGGSLPRISAYGLQSVADPSHWVIVAINRAIDRAALEPEDADYDAGDTGTVSCTLRSSFQSAATCSVFTAGIGNMREHNRYAEGQRLKTDGTFEADPLCVEFDTTWHSVDVPADVSRIVINDDLGADAGGLRGGNFLMIELTGVA